MTVLAGGVVATFAATGVIAVPLSFPLLAAALGLFVIGYTRLARDVPHAATFAALLTHGLGRAAGTAAAFVAVLSYNSVQIALYGLLGATAAGQLGGPWWAWALLAWAAVAAIGYRGVTLGAPVVAIVLALELGMIALFDVTALTHPAHTDIGAWLAPWRPDLLAVDGVGGVLAFGVAAFLGFETTAAFGEEARTEHSVGRATGTCLAFLGIFYGIGVGPSGRGGPRPHRRHRPRPELRDPVLRPGHRSRSDRAVHGRRRGHAAGRLGARSDDRLAPGRRPLPVRARARACPAPGVGVHQQPP